MKYSDTQRIFDLLEACSTGFPEGNAKVHENWLRLVDVPVRIYQTYFKGSSTPMRIPDADRELLVEAGMLEYHQADDGTTYAGFTVAGWLVAQIIHRAKTNREAQQAMLVRQLKGELRDKERQIRELESALHITMVG